jgi:very-short-patch-repair endonuclease
VSSFFHSIHGELSAEADHDALCHLYARKMKAGALFCGNTAARLWGIPLPLGSLSTGAIEVSTPHHSSRARGRGVAGREHDPARVVSRLVRGLPVLAPADTWCSLRLSAPDLVAAADFLVTGSPPLKLAPLCTLDDLDDAMRSRAHVPGIVSLRTARGLVREGSWSRTETLLRLVLTLAGLPEAKLNYRVARGAVIDLAWPHFKFGIEYDGEFHRESSRFAADIRRQEAVHDIDWQLMRVTKYDLFDQPEAMVNRARARLIARGARISRIDPSKVVRVRR